MNTKKTANIILCIFLGTAAAIGLVVCSSALSPKGLFMGGKSVSPTISSLKGEITLKMYELGQDPSNWVKAAFLIDNSSNKDVKNLKVQCEFFDEEGRYCDTDLWLLYGTVPAGKQLIHRSLNRKFINSRSANLRCELVDLKIVPPAVTTSQGHEEVHGEEAGGNEVTKPAAPQGHGSDH